MKERPILFSAPMVRALLNGSKTQTRRLVKPQPEAHQHIARHLGDGDWQFVPDVHILADCVSTLRCPYGQPGDRLWVRETCRAEELPDGMDGVRYIANNGFIALRPGEGAVDRWLDLRDYGKRPSPVARIKTVPAIHMPRWASRITLELTGVRVERLQNISEADAIAEGIDRSPSMGKLGAFQWCDYRLPNEPSEWFNEPVRSYQTLWESINGPGSWEANPWVWVVEFKRVMP